MLGITPKQEPNMKLSARNQLKGTVETVTEGAVNGVVTVKVGQDAIAAGITMEAIKALGLETGKEVTVVVKATNVLIATGSERLARLSARNQLAGTVTKVTRGAVNGHVSLKLHGGGTLTSSITNEAIDELGLAEGAPALAIVKATDVMVAV
jgi:molybdate transport system regulatory protein